jgi:hypothetical protein
MPGWLIKRPSSGGLDRGRGERAGKESPTEMWAGGEPSPGADATRVSAAPVQIWQRWAQSRCRCGQGVSEVPVHMWHGVAAGGCRCGSGGPSPGADVAAGGCRCGRGGPSPGADVTGLTHRRVATRLRCATQLRVLQEMPVLDSTASRPLRQVPLPPHDLACHSPALLQHIALSAAVPVHLRANEQHNVVCCDACGCQRRAASTSGR